MSDETLVTCMVMMMLMLFVYAMILSNWRK